MDFSKAVRNVFILTAFYAAPAAAAPADGRLYFATIVDPSVKVYLDGTLLDEVGSGKWAALPVTPGVHRLRVEDPKGSADERQVDFDLAQLAAAKNGRWWCAVSVPDRMSKVRLVIMDQAACKSFVDEGN